MPARIDEGEWLAELQRLQSRNGEGLTTAEWGVKLGVSSLTARKRLGFAKAAGWLLKSMAQRESLHGGMTTVPVYRIVKPRK